jgi:hypothetical protein
MLRTTLQHWTSPSHLKCFASGKCKNHHWLTVGFANELLDTKFRSHRLKDKCKVHYLSPHRRPTATHHRHPPHCQDQFRRNHFHLHRLHLNLPPQPSLPSLFSTDSFSQSPPIVSKGSSMLLLDSTYSSWLLQAIQRAEATLSILK